MSQPQSRTLSPTTVMLIVLVAIIGFAFDTYELLMGPLVVRGALMELGNMKPGSDNFKDAVSMFFYLPALVGGACGLVGGYLTDRFGRRRILTFSILLYAFSALAAGFSTSLTMLLIFRTTTFAGVCIEFVAAVAWLAEIFTDPKEREQKLGFTQAFSSFGGLMVTGFHTLASIYGESFPAIYGAHSEWRYTLISGVIPAIPLILIRPFLPESPEWERKKQDGTLRRPSIAELFAPALKRTTLISTIGMACAYGAAFGAIQQLPQIVPGLPGVSDLPRPKQEPIIANVQMYQEVGGLIGRFLLAWLAVRIIHRGTLLRMFQLPGLIILPLVFLIPARGDLEMLKWGAALVGLFTVAQFSFWGNYLPRVYPVHLRGTGESFAANVGGRMIGTGAAFLTAQLAKSLPGSPAAQFAVGAAIVGTGVYLVGTLVGFSLPEPPKEMSDEA